MPADPNARTSYKIQVKNPAPPRFFSFKWRIMTPVLITLMLALMGGAYGLAYALSSTEQHSSADVLTSRERIAENTLTLATTLSTEVDRIAFTQEVPFYIQNRDGGALQNIIEPLAALADLDFVVVGDPDGGEILGLQRVINADTSDYAVTSQTELNSIQAVQSVLGGAPLAGNIIMVERRPMLVVTGPVKQGDTLVGVVLVGMDIPRVLNSIQEDANVTLFGGDAVFIGSTLDKPIRNLDSDVFQAALKNTQEATVETVSIQEKPYQATYMPLMMGQTPLGVLAVYQEENITASSFARQMTGLFAAGIMGVVCVTGYFSVSWQTRRIHRITQVADKLAAGEEARTNMQVRDEVSAMGVALDRYAAAAKLHVQQIQNDLRQEQRQVSHLQAILESLPHGILVQDMEGRVLTMNGTARELLGVYGDSQEAQQLKLWAAQVSYRLGKEIIPGVFAINETTQIQLKDRMLHVQAASLITMADKPIGTLLMLQEVPESVAKASRRESMLKELAQDEQQMKKVVREIAGDSRAVQHMINEYHNLTVLRPNELREKQQAVNVADLLLTLIEAWRSPALAADIDLEISLLDDEIYVLGDEKRLRQALGNVIENSIKYSMPGAQIFVQAYPIIEESRMEFLIEDTGVGIAAGELPHVFTRFYRGKPTLPDGTRLKVQGSGQGLFLARQILQAHGGQITLASKPGEGTQVSILLPLTADVSMIIEPEMVSLWDQPTTKMRLEKHH